MHGKRFFLSRFRKLTKGCSAVRKTSKYLVATAFLIAAVILAVGVVFARYTASVKGNIPFSVLDSEYLNICGTVTSKTEDLPSLPTSFSYAENGDATYAFSVVNAKTSTDICSTDLLFTLKLSVTEGFDGEGNITLYLTDDGTVNENSVAYTGKISKTEEGSSLYKENGPGYTCRFFDDDGNEKIFELTGGSLSAKNFVLTVNGNADTSLFRLTAIPVVK